MARNIGLLVLTKSLVAKRAALLLLGLVLVLCAPGVADAASAPSSWGDAPSGLDQSGCGGMSISPHVVYAGEDVTATTTANTADCAAPGGTPGQSWSWQYVPGTVVSGCTEDSSTCVWQTGATGGWDEYCMSGAAWVGPWDSCDYYGAVSGTPTISVSVSPGSIKADGKSTATVTATVSDTGSPESGDDISFSSSDGGQSIGAVTDNGDGTYTAMITASRKSGNATITASDASSSPTVTATTTLTSTAATEPISGNVSGTSCSETTCQLSGLPGVQLVATGTAADGTAVTQSTTSAADGTYSLEVPPGTYTVGPSVDGITADGTGFEPQPQTGVVVGSAPVAGPNFSACTVPSSVSDDDADRKAGAQFQSGAVAHTPGVTSPRLLAHIGNVTASACKSVYTVKLSAEIPQKDLVDFSTRARYQTDDGLGYNTSPAGFPGQHNPDLRNVADLASEFPACFSAAAVKRDSEETTYKIIDSRGGPMRETIPAFAEWYSYLKGGSLGSASASFAWNRSTQTVNVVSGPTVATARLTRVFKFAFHIHGKIQKGQCSEVSRVPVEVFPVGGSDTPGGPASNTFTMIVAWPIPFEPSGINLDVESALTQQAVEKVEQFDDAIESIFTAFGDSYAHAPEPLKFGVQLGLVTLGEIKLVGILGKGAALAESALEDYKFASNVATGIHTSAEVAHWSKFAQESVQEIFNLFGAFGGGYPMISAVVRGHFQTTYLQYGGQDVVLNGKKIPAKSILGLSVSAPEFPDISLQVDREAADNDDTNEPAYSGLLPWSGSGGSLVVDTVNPFAAEHPASLISDVDNKEYLRGLTAVKEINEAAEANPAVEKGLEVTGNLVSDFAAEQNSAPAPNCNVSDDHPLSANTICWGFTDQRP
jgi:Invasin, domain 3